MHDTPRMRGGQPIGALIERVRGEAGKSQEALAAALRAASGNHGVDREAVSRWENGKRIPTPYWRDYLSTVLGISLDLLDRAAAVARAQRAGGKSAKAVVELQGQLSDLETRYDLTPSTSLLPITGPLLSDAMSMRARAVTDPVRRELLAVEAQSATLMGQLVWDASQRRDHATANVYYDQAILAAEDIGAQPLKAHALLRKSFVTLYGEQDPRRGLLLAQQAATVAGGGSSRALEGLALLHVGEAFAMLGDRNGCEDALSVAESRLDRVEPADPAYRLFCPEQLGRLKGSCYLFLGDARRAQPVLEATAWSLRGRQKSQAIVLANLALAHLRQHHLDGATATLHQAIEVVERTRGGGALNVLFAAGRELRPWQHEPGVQSVHDRLFTLVAA
jgi:transcriptional regulator with XRE-family HTH domain